MSESNSQKIDRREFVAGIAGVAMAAGLGDIQAQSTTAPSTNPTTAPTVDRQDVFRFDETHQTIENFSASDCWTCEPAGQWPDEGSKNRIADLLFSRDKGIGLSAWRINLGAGWDFTIHRKDRTADCFETAPGKYDFSRCPGQQWFAQAAKARGVDQFIAFVNSPPLRMTRSGHSYGNKNADTTNLKEGMEGEFAKYMVDIVEHFKTAPDAQRIPYTHLSPINEPDVAWDGPGQEGCRYNLEDIRRTLKVVSEEIIRRKVDVQMIAPETNQAHHLIEGRKYLDGLAGHPDTKGILHQRLCYHDYDVVWFKPNTVERRKRIGEALKKYPGWSLWMSEYCILEWKRDLTMHSAIHLARLMHFDLTLADVTAWQWWLALSFMDYKDGLLFADRETYEIIIPKMFWAMGNYSRFIRPGAQRIGFSGSDSFETQTLVSAYRHDGDRQIMVVYVNLDGPDATVIPRVELPQNVKLSDWQIHRTSDAPGEDLLAIGKLAQGGQLMLPARSVTTLVCQFH